MEADIVDSCFNERYQVVSDKTSAKAHPAAQYRHFNDALSSQTFLLRELYAGADFWRYFLHRQYSSVPAFSDLQLLNEIARLTAQQKIRFYKLPQITRQVMLHDSRGTGYHFIKGPEPLPQAGRSPLDIQTEEQAYEIINSLNAGDSFWRNYLEKQALIPAQNQLSALNTYQSDINSYIAGLMRAHDILLYSQPYVPAPPVAPAPEYLPLRKTDRPALPMPPRKKQESIYINYQIDIDEINNVNDKLMLMHNESDYVHSIVVGVLLEFDHDWVCLEFPDPPQNGSYSLEHDPQDESLVVYTVFKNVPFSKLANLTPELQRPKK